MAQQFQDRWYQTEAVESVFDYFAEGNVGNPVIALPTGTGKSVVIARLAQRILKTWPGQRMMMLTHVKELVEQNALKLQAIWPTAPMGIYSAGLRQRDTVMPIIFGGVASVANCTPMFGHRDLMLIDEAHLLSPKDGSMYQEIIHELKVINPWLKIIGLTATPFRLGQGMITDGGIFTDICYDQTGTEAFNRLISEGYLCTLVPRRTKVERQSEVMLMGANGDFSGAALEADAAQKDVTYKALVELCENGQDRHSWLVFASTIDDADYIADTLRNFGVSAAAIHSKMKRSDCDKIIVAYKRGEIRCLVNMGMLTTGFDHPPLDLIAVLRRTMSPVLWVQMLGRGTRPSPDTGKENCLVLDFAGNTRRLGPINDPQIPRKKGKGTGDAPVKICEHCGTYNHASVRVCSFCGEEFEFETKIVARAGEEELIRSDLPVIEVFDVRQCMYYLHEKIGSPPSIRVDYDCGIRKFSEWVCIEHAGFSGKKARDWWRVRFPGDYMPETTREALEGITSLKVPNQIKVWCNKKHPEILGYMYA